MNIPCILGLGVSNVLDINRKNMVYNLVKFLVTGSAGLIGTRLVQDLASTNHKVFSCYHNARPTLGQAIFLDLMDHQSIIDTVQKTRPDIIIHLAAMTDVDMCETQKDLALKLNRDATAVLAEEACKAGAFFVYVSTDYVFDGTGSMQKEHDQTNPLGVYGKTKLAGENLLAKSACVVRTSTPFGIHPTKVSFPLWVKQSLEQCQEIQVLTDQFTSPTYVPNLSKMLLETVTKKIHGPIHLAGSTRISRYDVAKFIAEKLHLDSNLLIPTTLDKISWNAPRPQDSSLDVSLASMKLDTKPMTAHAGLEMFLSEL